MRPKTRKLHVWEQVLRTLEMAVISVRDMWDEEDEALEEMA